MSKRVVLHEEGFPGPITITFGSQTTTGPTGPSIAPATSDVIRRADQQLQWCFDHLLTPTLDYAKFKANAGLVLDAKNAEAQAQLLQQFPPKAKRLPSQSQPERWVDACLELLRAERAVLLGKEDIGLAHAYKALEISDQAAGFVFESEDRDSRAKGGIATAEIKSGRAKEECARSFAKAPAGEWKTKLAAATAIAPDIAETLGGEFADAHKNGTLVSRILRWLRDDEELVALFNAHRNRT